MAYVQGVPIYFGIGIVICTPHLFLKSQKGRNKRPFLKFFKLDNKQQDKLKAWLETIPRQIYNESEEDCCMSGSIYTASFYTSGVGDVFYIQTVRNGCKYTCHLSYDDDGNLVD